MASKRLRVVPSAGPKPVWIVAFADVQTLDVTGPLEMFSIANRVDPSRAPRYAVSLIAPSSGAIVSSSDPLFVRDGARSRSGLA